MIEEHQDAHAVCANDKFIFLSGAWDIKSDVSVTLVQLPMDFTSSELLVVVSVECVETLLNFSWDLDLQHQIFDSVELLDHWGIFVVVGPLTRGKYLN